MTETQTLPRMTEAPVAPAVHAIAYDAASLLGYHALQADGQKERDEARLFEACVACGIRPFLTSAVEAYKQTKHRKKEADAKAAFMRGYLGDRDCFNAKKLAEAESKWLSELHSFYDGRNRFAWRQHGLKGYHRPVPVGVVEMAVRLKRQQPNVDFRVHELEENRRIDPFLSVTLGQAEFYIAVWDEPGFEAKYD